MNMKHLILIALVSCLLGCTRSTSVGDCIGITDKEYSGFVYEYSKKNIIIGIIGVETVVVPINVLLYNLKCPIGDRIIR